MATIQIFNDNLSFYSSWIVSRRSDGTNYISTPPTGETKKITIDLSGENAIPKGARNIRAVFHAEVNLTPIGGFQSATVNGISFLNGDVEVTGITQETTSRQFTLYVKPNGSANMSLGWHQLTTVVTNIYLLISYEYGGSVFTLNKSTVSIGEPLGLQISSYSPTYTHRWTIKGSYENTEITKQISIPAGITSVQYNFPFDDSVGDWGTIMPKSTSAIVVLKMETLVDGQAINTVQKNIVLTYPTSNAGKPVVTSFTSQANPSNIFGVYLKGVTACILNAAASGAHGSTIASYVFTGGINKTIQSSQSTQRITTSALAASTTYNVYVVDSRGIASNPLSLTVDVVEYIQPSITGFSISRCDIDGADDPNGAYCHVVATYRNGSELVGEVENNTTIQLSYQETGATEWIPVQVEAQNNRIDLVFGGALLGTKTYTIRVMVKDLASTRTGVKTLTTASLFMRWDSKKRVFCFGAVSTDPTDVVYVGGNMKLHVAGNSQFDGEVTHDGTTQLNDTAFLADGKQIRRDHKASGWTGSEANAALRMNRINNGFWWPSISMESPNGHWSIGTEGVAATGDGDRMIFNYTNGNEYNNIWLSKQGNVRAKAFECLKINTQNTYQEFSLNTVFPVGFVYISIENTNPSTLFGGTWQSVSEWNITGTYAWKRIS